MIRISRRPYSQHAGRHQFFRSLRGRQVRRATDKLSELEKEKKHKEDVIDEIGGLDGNSIFKVGMLAQFLELKSLRGNFYTNSMFYEQKDGKRYLRKDLILEAVKAFKEINDYDKKLLIIKILNSNFDIEKVNISKEEREKILNVYRLINDLSIPFQFNKISKEVIMKTANEY